MDLHNRFLHLQNYDNKNFGALYYIKGRILDDFILVFGDVMLSVDWKRFMDFHKSKQAFITLYGHPNMNIYIPSGTIAKITLDYLP